MTWEKRLTDAITGAINRRQNFIDADALIVKTLIFSLIHYAPQDVLCVGAGVVLTDSANKRLARKFAVGGAGSPRSKRGLTKSKRVAVDGRTGEEAVQEYFAKRGVSAQSVRRTRTGTLMAYKLD